MNKPSLRLLTLGAATAIVGVVTYWSIPRSAPERPAVSPVPASAHATAALAPSTGVMATAAVAAPPAEPVLTPAPADLAVDLEHSPSAVPARLLFGSSWQHEPRPSLAAFDHWAEKYIAASPEDRTAMVFEGVRLAQARQADLRDMIQNDPRQAIASTVPMAVRGQLPAEVQDLLEARVGALGRLSLIGGVPLTGTTTPVANYHSALIDGQEYRAYVYGRREQQTTKVNISIQGVALDRALAVSESPARALEPGEAVSPAKVTGKNCPVSGNPAASPVASPAGNLAASAPAAVQVGSTIVPLCHLEHIEQYESQLVAAEDAAGPYDQQVADWKILQADGKAGTSGVPGRPSVAWSTGTKKVIMILVDFSDVPGPPLYIFSTTPIDKTYVNNLFNNATGIAAFYAQGSYNLAHLALTAADVTVPLRMPNTAAYYASNGLNSQLHNDAEAAATAAGFNLNNYDRIGVVFTFMGNLPNSQINYGGLGELQGRRFWVNGEADFRVCAHELGHTFGLQHCNLWQVSDGNPVSDSGYSVEYADPFGVMGGGSTDINYQFDPWQKSILHWIPDLSVPVVTTQGTYRVYRFDHPNANTAANPMALKVVRNSTEDYWINYRLLFGPGKYPSLQNGAYILWGYNSVVQGNLLDMTTPGTNATDAALQIGTTFYDAKTGITLQPVDKGGTTPNEYLDVQIGFYPHVDWTPASIAVDQQAGTVTLTATRSGDLSLPISVDYATADDSAISPRDYGATSGTLAWASGDPATKTITIPIVANSSLTTVSDFTVTMSNPTGAVVGNGVATVSIAAAGLTDPGFSPNNFSASIAKVLRQPDGKLLVAGSFNSQVTNGVFSWGAGFTRLNADGSLDRSFFNSAGVDVVPVKAMALQPDGRILLGGFFTAVNGVASNQLVRLNADGTIDASFTPGTGPDGAVRAILVQPDGKILIGGDFLNVNGTPSLYVARLNPDGSVDTTFTGPAFATTGGFWHVNTIVLQPDNKVLLGGGFYFVAAQSRSGIARLNADGSLDTTFSPGAGAQLTGGSAGGLPEVYALALQADGSIVLGGTFNNFNGAPRGYLARVGFNGTLDGNYTGTASAPVQALQLQPDGRLLVGGAFNNLSGAACRFLGRLNTDGSPDLNFHTGTTSAIGSPSAVNDWALAPDGTAIAAITYGSSTGTPAQLVRVFTGLAGKVSSVQFAAAAAAGPEGQSVNVSATRVGATTGPLSVNYATQDLGSNTGRFTPVSGTLTWADGDATARTIPVPLVNDGVFEGAGQVAVNLGPVSGGALNGTPGQEVITINADPKDSAGPVLTITSPANNSVSGFVTVTITGTATDAGAGNEGVASVTVNGTAASGTPVTGGATMSWSGSVTLTTGLNTITVTAKDTTGNSTTKLLKVTYSLPPVISTQPASVSIMPNNTATLSVAISSSSTSNPAVTYQWYQGLSGDLTTPVAGQNGPSFTTPSLTASASYWVTVTNSNQSSAYSNTATVSVAVPPTITTGPSGSTINSGQPVTLTVVAGASGATDPTITYAWYSGVSGNTSSGVLGSGSSFSPASLTATTSFWVRLINSAGFTADSAAAVVTVNTPPQIGTPPASGRVNPGVTATLTVTASATGTSDASLSYQWYQGLTGNTTTPVGTNAASYTTPALTAGASYWVRLTNSASVTTDSPTASIVINQKPTISRSPASVTISAGDSPSLLVVVSQSGTDVPGVTYQWYQGSVGDLSKPVGTGASVLSLQGISATASYYVRVTNSTGLYVDSSVAMVTVNHPPTISAPPVGGTVIANYNKLHLKVGVSSSGTSDTTVHYQWYQGQSGDSTTPVGTDIPTFDTPVLKASTAYWVKVTNTYQLSTSSGTAEVRVEQAALPNLVPLPLTGAWSDAVIVSRNPHATADDTLLPSNAALFVAASYRNIGSGPSKAGFHGTITLQPGNKVISFVQAAALAPGAGAGQVAKATLGLGKLPAGSYTLTLHLDTTAIMAEILTTDNAYTKHFVVTDPVVTTLATPTKMRGTASMVSSVPGEDLFWTPADARATSFTVERHQFVNKKWTAWEPAGTSATNSWRDTTVVAGATYQYHVQETDGTRVSAFSLPSASLVIPATPAAQKLAELTATAPVFYPAATTANPSPTPRVDAPLTDVADVLTSITVTNSGAVATSTLGFAVTFEVDGKYRFVKHTTDFKVKALAAGASVQFLDVDLGRLASGSHNVTVYLDSAHQVDESTETGNSQTKAITVSGTQPDLTGLVDSSQGWTTPFIVATQPAATTSATSIHPADTVYVSLAITNVGTDIPATRDFNLVFFVDGLPTQIPSLQPQAITPGTEDTWILQDLNLGSFPLGPHTLSVKIDSEDNVVECDETDDLLSTHFTVVKPPATAAGH